MKDYRKVSLSATLINGWHVSAMVDDDGHLNVYIENGDGTDIIDTGQGDGVNGEQLALRFTTQRIEDESHAEEGEG